MKIFALKATEELGAAVASCAGVTLAGHEEREFEDGEFKVRALESVRASHVIVCQSLHGDAGQSTNDKLCRLAFFVGALKDAGAREVTALAPYLAYARKDRRTKPRDPVTLRYVASMLEAVGLDAVLTMDVHNPAAFDNAFRCRKEHLEAAGLVAAHFAGRLPAEKPLVVLSPDFGGGKRAAGFSEALAASTGRPVQLAFMGKQRSEGAVSGSAFAGDVEGAAVVVFDDLVSSGTTLLRAARACRERGAAEVHAAVTHAVLAPNAARALAGGELDSIVVTDTIGNLESRCPELADRLVVVSAAGLFAEAVRRIANA